MKLFQSLLSCVVLVIGLNSCGAVAFVNKDSAAVSAGFISKIGQADVKVVSSGGGSIEIHQTAYNGTEFANTMALTVPVTVAARGVAATNLAHEGTAKITAQGNAQALVKSTKDPNIIPLNPNIIPKNPNVLP